MRKHPFGRIAGGAAALAPAIRHYRGSHRQIHRDRDNLKLKLRYKGLLIMPTRITVYFGTNRQPQTNPAGDLIVGFGSDPGPVSGYAVRFGQASVDVDLPQQKSVLVPGSLSVAPEILTPAPGAAPQFGSRTIFEAIRQSMSTNGLPTLVFIHGFSNSFQDAIERAGWVSAFYAQGGFTANIFVFTWPSRGGPLGVPLPYIDYEHDRSTAATSGPAVGRTLRLLYDFVDGLARLRNPT